MYINIFNIFIIVNARKIGYTEWMNNKLKFVYSWVIKLHRYAKKWVSFSHDPSLSFPSFLSLSFSISLLCFSLRYSLLFYFTLSFFFFSQFLLPLTLFSFSFFYSQLLLIIFYVSNFSSSIFTSWDLLSVEFFYPGHCIFCTLTYSERKVCLYTTYV